MSHDSNNGMARVQADSRPRAQADSETVVQPHARRVQAEVSVRSHFRWRSIEQLCAAEQPWKQVP